jgi:hypothetical protein
MDAGQYASVWFVIALAQALLIVNGFTLRRRRATVLAAA